MKYFYISSGLRGCYADDNGGIYAFKSRRDLKDAIIEYCNDSREAYGFGGSKAEIAAVAAWAWKQKKSSLPMAIGFGHSRSVSDRPFGIFVSKATVQEYNEFCKQND